MIYLINTDTCFWIACSIDDKKSYHKIYKIKKRWYEKPLAIMVNSFNRLEKNTTLTKEQIEFLKNYEKPFTILTDSSPIKHRINFEDEDWEFINKDIYKKIAFRVAHNSNQKKLIKKIWPIFLTSANTSWETEIYDEKILLEQFKYYLDNWIVKFLNNESIREKQENKRKNKKSPSDIFSFIGNSLEIEYLRKS